MLKALSAIVEDLGRQMLTWRGTDATDGVWEGSQLKTEADMRAHRFLKTQLFSLAPDLPFVSEEDLGSQNTERPSRYWLADPIDGTASFAGGFSGFVTQVALMENNRPVLAAIRAPALGQTFLAQHRQGATLNGASLDVRGRSNLLSLIDNYPEPRGIALALFNDLGFERYMESGSISLKICRVADGSADAFVKDVTVRDWDIAAPHLVLKEAGGTLALGDGESPVYEGAYEKRGLIATTNPGNRQRIAHWFSTIANKEVPS